MSISDSLKADFRTYSVARNAAKHPVAMYSFEPDASGKWLTGNQSILETLARGLGGYRGHRHAPVRGDRLEEFCKHFLEAARTHNKRVMAAGGFRAWALEFAERNRQKSADELAKDAMQKAIASAAEADELDNLDEALSDLNPELKKPRP